MQRGCGVSISSAYNLAGKAVYRASSALVGKAFFCCLQKAWFVSEYQVLSGIPDHPTRYKKI
jgi:hypothetical protein